MHIYISSSLISVTTYKLSSVMSGLFRLIVALPSALAGLIISEFAGDISSRIISRLIDKLKSFISNRGQMVLARALEIEHSDDDNKWMWVAQQDSRFEEVVGLLKVHWLEIQATISFIRLTAETTYAAYLIFKTTQNSTCLDTLQEASVSVGNLQLKKDVCIKPRVANPRNKCNAFPLNGPDGWMELELGQFYCDGHGGEVVVSLRDINIKNEKNGRIIAGIQVHPI